MCEFTNLNISTYGIIIIYNILEFKKEKKKLCHSSGYCTIYCERKSSCILKIIIQEKKSSQIGN